VWSGIVVLLTVLASLAGNAEPVGSKESAGDGSGGHLTTTATTNRHWSFQPIKDPRVPTVRNQRWPRHDLDRFILARIEAEGMTPNIAADRRAIIRRATFDLTGLPPSPAEVEDFVRDGSLAAFERVVDRLLDSPRYGERWGRHWLDLARYADTAGDSSDFPVPQAWRYRNYVIDAFNRDKPYDQFLREQIAGDLLPAATEGARREQIIATGFLACAKRLGAGDSNAVHLMIEDMLDTISQATLGLSLSCARCHDHKYDPISMRDYYALYGILNSTRVPFTGSELEPRQRNFVPLLPPSEVEALLTPYRKKIEAVDAEIARLEKEMATLQQEGFKIDPLQMDFDAAWKQRDKLTARPPVMETAYAAADGKAGNARLQKRGDPLMPGEEVPRRFLQVLGGQALPADCPNSGRLEMARWLADRTNPLTARVMVNRLWQHHFGRGLVATPSDFGTRGATPSHPDLLDYLATRFIESGWSVKAMHRLMVLSATYQQGCVPAAAHMAMDLGESAQPIPSKVSPDPDNILLSRFPRQRLDAEQIRDALLTVSGALDLTVGGAHPFPQESKWKFSQHEPFSALYETNRRSVYLMQPRLRRQPFFAVFDGADANVSTAQRQVSTTPLQALFAMNDPFAHEQADMFARRLLRERPDDRQRLDLAFQLAYARPTSPEEIRDGLAWLSRLRAALAAENHSPDDAQFTVWSSYARALLGSSEFFFVD